MVSLLVPTLVTFLAEPGSTEGSGNKIKHMMHDYGLQRLLHISSQYPNQFRAVMHIAPELKLKLERAVKAHHESERATDEKSVTSSSATLQKPTIQLKTDFSNFKG